MTDQTLEDELAAAIVTIIGDKSKNGLSPQGEAAVRLALHCARLQAQLAEAKQEVTHLAVFAEDASQVTHVENVTFPQPVTGKSIQVTVGDQQTAETNRDETPERETDDEDPWKVEF